MIIGQPLSQADLWSDVPPVDASVIMSATTSGQLDYWSAFGVRLTFGQMYPPVDASVIMSATTSGQLDYWSAFESG